MLKNWTRFSVHLVSQTLLFGSYRCRELEKNLMLITGKKLSKVLLRTFRTGFQNNLLRSLINFFFIKMKQSSIWGREKRQAQYYQCFWQQPCLLPVLEGKAPMSDCSCRNWLDSDLSGCNSNTSIFAIKIWVSDLLNIQYINTQADCPSA